MTTKGLESTQPLLDKKTKGSGTSERIRKKLRHFFHSNTFHYLLGTLIFLDLSIVLTDIILILIYCDDMPHDVEEAVHDLIYASVGILGTFLIELMLQMYAFGVKQWCSQCLHTFDFIIVFIAFTLELVFIGNPAIESIVGLLIVFRLWRLVRVIHVTTEALDLSNELKHHQLQQTIQKLEKKLKGNDKCDIELEVFTFDFFVK